ncbi:DNA topoisomerase 3 [bacterium]|nr:DNA topoisomerase 3 [bacterium]
MSKILIIAEKPSVAKDIAKALGGFTNEKEYLESDSQIITWAVGHLLEFIPPEEIDAKYKPWLLETLPILPDEFKYKIKDKCAARIKVISKLIKRKDVEALVNACDAGREGELIFREIVNYCKSKKPILRLWLQSMTAESIRTEFANLRPGKDYENLYKAAQCRSEADWLIGINATRALTRRMKTRNENTSWSAGRVQTPTLAMLTSRELEILTFRPSPFWKVKATFALLPQDEDSPTYEATWFDPKFSKSDECHKEDWILDRDKAQHIIESVSGREGIANETQTPEKISAPGLFDLTTLQREANRRFGMSAKHTLNAAQSLYETHKLITYPRTSSKCLPSDYVATVRQLLGMFSNNRSRGVDGYLDFSLYGKFAALINEQEKLLNYGKIFNDKAISDHFAIIPTLQMASGNLREDEAKIYNLIVRRFLAAFMPVSIKIKIERVTKVKKGRETFYFKTRSSYIKEEGWQAVYGRESQEKDQNLTPLPDKDTKVINTDCKLEDEVTQPPARISEARLLSLMENAGKQVEDESLSLAIKEMGLGTPATRAEIIEALITRKYAERADKALKATVKGIILIDLLQRIECKRLASAELTGQMEYNLNQVEQGQYARKKYMQDIVDYTCEIVDKAKTFQYEDLYAGEEPLGPCPLCHEHQVYEGVRYYICAGNRNGKKEEHTCDFILWKDRNGRYLDKQTVKELLNSGETPYLEGFKGTGTQTYKAKLLIRDGEVVTETEKGQSLDLPDVDLPVSGEVLGICPFDSNCQVFETPSAYVCQQNCVRSGAHRKGLNIPRIICQRPLSHEELALLLQEGKTEMYNDFVSKYNKNFTGAIVLNETSGRYRFEFMPRQRATKKAKEEK